MILAQGIRMGSLPKMFLVVGFSSIISNTGLVGGKCASSMNLECESIVRQALFGNWALPRALLDEYGEIT